MEKVLNYFIKNSVVVNLLTIIVIIMGLFGLFSLNKETFPNVDFNFIVVSVSYPGAAAEDVEKLIAIDIERELKEVNGIDELNTLSSEGGLIVSIKVDPDENVDDVLTETKDAVDRVILPDDALDPWIRKITNKTRGIMTVAISGGDSSSDLREKAKQVRDTLELESFISKVELVGFQEDVFYIEGNPDKLKQFDVTLTQISAAISDRETNLSAGNVKTSHGQVFVRTLNENTTVKDLEKIVIRSNFEGTTIKVSDVAKVSRTLKDASRKSRTSGKDSLLFNINTKTKADILESASRIKQILNEEIDGKKYEFEVFNDMSFYVDRRLGVLTQNGMQGIILVLICLMLFMNARISIITSLGAPFAFLVSFALMDSFGITINLISMFGLIMVLGMLVDDSIIVAEQYYQNLETGLEPKAAALKAAKETFGPVSATIITTMIAFSSLFFMDGIMGKFLWPVPAVVIIALFASWFECFVLLPGHLADFAPIYKKEKPKKWYEWLLRRYNKVLDWVITHSKLTVFVFSLTFIIAIITAFNMRFELFPSDDITLAQVNIKGPIENTFEQTQEQVIKVEQAILKSLKKNEMKGIIATAGHQTLEGGRSKSGDQYANIRVELTMASERERSVATLLDIVSNQTKQALDDSYEFSLRKFKGGPPTGKAINIDLYGTKLEELKIIANKVQKDILDFKGVNSAEIDFEEGKEQVIVQINEEEARRLGLTNKQIALELRHVVEGITAIKIKENSEDIDVIVKTDENKLKTIDQLQNVFVTNAQGRSIQLSKFATFKKQKGIYLIRRFNRKRIITITGEINNELTTALEVNKTIKKYLAKELQDKPHMRFELTGENKDTKESLDSFKKALVLSIAIIFVIIVIQFSSLTQPLIIMLTIPFGFIGVVFSFAILGLPIGFMALMGVLGLVGVVINDSIVLVTFINRLLIEEGANDTSIIKGSLSRFRPVILTTFTTVAGLLPVAHATGGDPFLKPMATSFAYGLLFSSLITLFFVPACFKVILDFNNKRRPKEK